MGKRNPMLEKLEAQIATKYRIHFLRQMDILLQMGQEAAQRAAHATLGMGPGRAVAFTVAYREAMNANARLVVEDAQDDEQIWYAKAKSDEEIKAIVGEENFAPWEERFSFDNTLLKDTASAIWLLTMMDAAKEGRLVVMPSKEAARALAEELRRVV